jgi:hypothetical protein
MLIPIPSRPSVCIGHIHGENDITPHFVGDLIWTPKEIKPLTEDLTGALWHGGVEQDGADGDGSGALESWRQR